MPVIRTTFALDSREAEDSKFFNAVVDKIKDTCIQKLLDYVQVDTAYIIKLSPLDSKRVDVFDGIRYEQDLSVDKFDTCCKCKLYNLDAFECTRTGVLERTNDYCSHFERRSNPVFID